MSNTVASGLSSYAALRLLACDGGVVVGFARV